MTRPRRRRGGGLIVTLIVLVALALLADQGARWFTERAAASKFQSSQRLTSKPTITISGFPFLTQLARRRFAHVHLTATGVEVKQSVSGLRISSLSADLYGVRISSDLSSATTTSGSGRALISYSDLSRFAGTPISWGGSTADGHGRVKASKSVTVLGQSVTGSVSAEAVVSGRNRVSFDNPQVSVDSQPVSGDVSTQFANVLPALSLAGLPNGLTVQTVTAEQDGVLLTLTASNVSLH